MGKPIPTTLAYWKAPPDGRGPDLKFDKELFLGHHDEDIRPVLVHDVRGEEEQYSLEKNGFMMYTLQGDGARDVPDDGSGDEREREEMRRVLLDLTGAKDVRIFGFLTRKLPRDALTAQQFQGQRIQAPSPRPHVDFAPIGVEASILRVAPDLADVLRDASGNSSTGTSSKKSRYAILGVWRPLKQVQRDALVVSDWRSVPDEDYVVLDRANTVGPDRTMFVSIMRPRESHRWCYWSDMMPNEVLIFKHFDTCQDEGAWRCAHTSMVIPGTENLPARENVEMRALVIY